MDSLSESLHDSDTHSYPVPASRHLGRRRGL